MDGSGWKERSQEAIDVGVERGCGYFADVAMAGYESPDG